MGVTAQEAQPLKSRELRRACGEEPEMARAGAGVRPREGKPAEEGQAWDRLEADLPWLGLWKFDIVLASLVGMVTGEALGLLSLPQPRPLYFTKNPVF